MQVKFHPGLIILSLSICLFYCKPVKNYVVKVKPVTITKEDIFNKELISDYLFDAEEMQLDSLKSKSQRLFLRGVDLYKNKKNAAGSIALFKQSLLIFPDAKTYYELGNALVDAQVDTTGNYKKDLRDALNAFEVAQYLKFQPLSQIHYNMARAENLLKKVDSNDNEAIYYLGMAFDEGFKDTSLLKKDIRINSIVKTSTYKELIIQWAQKELRGKDENFFDTYKKSFPPISQPFEITADKVGMSDYKEAISYDFASFIPEMGNTQFGRGVSNDFIYVGRIAETPLYTALLYFSINYYGGNMQPIHTNLVTYDARGNIIASRLFACQFSAEEIRTGKIENNEITLEDFKRIWKHPIDSIPFEQNTIVKLESIMKAKFKLSDSGKIIKVDVPKNYSDSSSIVSK
jgi:hypothetical protein